MTMKWIVLDIMRFKFFIVVYIGFTFSLTAQTKNEKESRVNLVDFPIEAQTLINTVVNDVKRVRHYKETDGDKISYETKFKQKKHWYSVEFDAFGTLEDIEVEIKERQIKDDIRNKINTYLKMESDNYDFLKIQEQYHFDSSKNAQTFLESVLVSRNSTASYYELIVAIKKDKQWYVKEITFDSAGLFLSERPLQQDSYEYIMY